MIPISPNHAAPAGHPLPLLLEFPDRLLLAEKCSVTAFFAATEVSPAADGSRTTVVAAIWKQIPRWRHYGINE